MNQSKSPLSYHIYCLVDKEDLVLTLNLNVCIYYKSASILPDEPKMS